ncbi:MAG TPA: NAD-glutamate dehydrogenase [Mesorhizobium sp.]|nr:NAD-glutamate dehydrogenase [Mesorhizobium sp.]
MGEAEKLKAILLARAPEEDLDTTPPPVVEAAARAAFHVLKRHRPGEREITVERVRDLPRSIVSVINDNMPFLFDSVTGEAAEILGEPSLVTHPVLLVRPGADGAPELLGDAHAGETAAKDTRETGLARVSLIQIHAGALDDARAEELKIRLNAVLDQVRAAVKDWKPMLARLDAAISMLRYGNSPLAPETVSEAVAFLEWLRDDNFTFLGLREFRYEGTAEEGSLVRAPEPGLGILRDPSLLILRRDADGSATTPEIRNFLHGPEPLIVSKANTKSRVHRRVYLDYVGVKTFNAEGRLAGELRFVGLFTSTAYTRSVFKIPFLRAKADSVLRQSGFDPADHSGKALVNVLESYPRDELFQVDAPTLARHAEAILALGERPRPRALVRVDPFDRFVSVIVFVPRDRYDSAVREKIGAYLKHAFEGRLSAFYPAFPEGSLARVHFIIGRSGGKTPAVEPATIEAAIRDITRIWEDFLRDAAAQEGADAAALATARRLPPAYRNTFSAATALRDARRLAALTDEAPIAIDFTRHEEQDPGQAALKIHHRGSAVSLSRRVPLLENMGFRVISEQTFEVPGEEADAESSPVFIHDMELENAFGAPVDLEGGAERLEEVFLSVWRADADNDGLNALVQTAKLGVSAIAVLRLYARYLQQAGIPQTQGFVSGVLNRHPGIAAELWTLFEARFDPAAQDREARAEAARARIAEALDAVPSLDDDTILRRLLELVNASLRTNHYAPAGEGRSRAIKLDPRALSFLPDPKPWREIFVYGPEVEGIHLRFGAVARGGLRWSDRAQDYRTEVLGLVKAQQVKNAVIVPVGAKGGFFPKRLPAGGTREAVFEAGRKAYVNFVSSLLSLTDNLVDGEIVPPEEVVRHDGDDAYFVVAADKGTATFSDTANAISQAHGFWLDDAFASGGSAGYDHKKMGITARGAWEAVKRHFREMNRDIQREPFTVAGVGDMSGDVFGNGMLLSPQIRLVAAFDHRDIFLDPDPDPAVAIAERQRLFELPRSSWQDYDKSKLSPGGMIVSRAQKSVELTPQATAALGLSPGATTPQAVLSAILRAPVDLLWFGGIGTYVKASAETHADAGDRANDAIRINAADLRAKVIGEGANLAVTQAARIEYGRRGGRCNSDAIDNSGGVNSSDVEVNIKIALAAAMRAGRLDRSARNELLASMTEEVAKLVLANNYGQALAISLDERRGPAELPRHARFMERIEARGLLDRDVEGLPWPTDIAELQARGQNLTRAEIGVLLAYAKIVLFSDLLETDAPDDASFADDLLGYFPGAMRERFADEIRDHPLRREIVSRVLVNDLVNRGGPSFAERLQEGTGCGPADVVLACAAARGGFELQELFAAVDRLDNRIDGQKQLDLYMDVARLVEGGAAWFLRNRRGTIAPDVEATRLVAARERLEPRLLDLLPPFLRENAEAREAELAGWGVPAELAAALARLDAAALIPDIALAAEESGSELGVAARVFFGVTEAFRLGRIEAAARTLQPTDPFDAMALDRALLAIGNARRALVIAALRAYPGDENAAARWLEGGGPTIRRALERLDGLTEGGELSLSRLTVAAGLMDDLVSVPVTAA